MKQKGKSTAFITVRLGATDIYESAAVALTNTHYNIDRGNVVSTITSPIYAGDAFTVSLGSVVAKLDGLVNIIDETSKVFPFLSLL